MLRIGLVGAGGIGRMHTDIIMNQVTSAAITAVSDIVPENIKKVTDKYPQVKVFDDPHALIRDPEIDAVLVATWDGNHEEFVVSCIKAGKYVFCEKPLSNTAQACVNIMNAEMEQEQPAEEPAEEPAETPAEEPAGEPEAQAPAAKRAMVIVINGENENAVYNGEEHVLDRYVATSNDDEFDPEKVKVSGDLGVKATDCGTYILDLEKAEFTYDDPNVAARFVVNNSFLKITPAPVTVTANEASKEEGQADPELTATVTGLFGEDTIEYTLTRAEGEAVGEYAIEAAGEEQQGNYRVQYFPGKLMITGEPVVTIEVSVPEGQAVYLGTEITLTAVPAGVGDVELTYQWQYSTDGENWNDIEGATKKVYKYELALENVEYEYRVSVDPVQ